MKRNYHIFLVFVLILMIPFFGNLPKLSGQDNYEKINDHEKIVPSLIASELDENASIPFLVTDDPIIELGDDINFFFGMRDGIAFKEDYNYSIYLAKGTIFLNNDSSLLSNYTLIIKGMTKNVIDEHHISTIGKLSPISPNPSNYTLLFVVNSTNRGLLNSTASFEIIVPPGAVVSHFFTSANFKELENDIINVNVNETQQLSIVLQNRGDTNAFNVTLSRTNINKPIGFGNFTIPDIISVLASSSEVIFNFTVTPTNFGIGKLSFNLEYTDGLGISAGSTPILEVRVLPRLTGSFQVGGSSVEIEYNDGEEIPINVFFTDLELVPLYPVIVSIELISDKMTFLHQEIPYIEGTNIYIFIGNPFEPGVVEITMKVIIFDDDGSDVTDYIIAFQTINFVAGSIPVSDDTDFSDYLPIISIILYFILLASFAILYYREDIRTKFFTGVLGLQILESIDYRTTSIVIDGSNIAWEQTNPKRKPMINNIIRSYKALKENGFKKIVIIADAALRYQIDDRDELDRLVKSGFIKLVPAKVNADGFILRFSAENGYLILSNDLYKEFRDTYSWIDERRVPYTILADRFYLHPTFD